MKIYLCGPINGCTDAEAMDWREAIKRSALLDFTIFVDPTKRDCRGREEIDYRLIVELDKRDVRGADIVLVNAGKPSWGTAMEIPYAWERGIPVVLWCPRDMNISPWLRYHCLSIVHSLDEAVAKILEIA